MSYNICDEELPEYGLNLCEVDKSAAISKIAYVKRGQTDITSWDNAVEWATAIANDNAVITGALSADIPDASPVTIDNKRACGSATKQISMDLTATFIDPNVSEENDLFYAGVNGKSYDIVFFYCKENEIRVFENGSVSARPAQSVGNQTETQHYNGSITFRLANDEMGLLFDAPAGIFE